MSECLILNYFVIFEAKYDGRPDLIQSIASSEYSQEMLSSLVAGVGYLKFLINYQK